MMRKTSKRLEFFFRNKKRFFFYSFLSLFILGITLFYAPVTEFLFSSCAKAYVRHALKKELRFGSIQWKKGSFIMEHLTIKDLKGKQPFFHLDKADLHLSFHPLSSKKIAIALEAYHPTLFLQNANGSSLLSHASDNKEEGDFDQIGINSADERGEKSPLSTALLQRWLATFAWKVKVHEGHYLCLDKENILDEGDFSFEMKDFYHPKLTLFDPISKKENLKIDFFQDAKEQHISCEIQGGSLKKITPLFHSLFPQQSFLWQTHKQQYIPTHLDGICSGSLTVAFKDQKLSSFSLSLKIDDLDWIDEETHLFFKQMQMEAISSVDLTQADAFVFSWVPKDLVMRVSLVDGAILSKASQAQLEQIQGSLSYNSSAGPKWELFAKNQGSPLCFKGKGYFQSSVSNWLEGSLTFGEHTKQEGVFFNVKEDQQKKGEIRVNLQKIQAAHCSLFSSFFQKIFPEMAPWKISQGEVTSQVYALYEKHHFVELKIEDLHAEDFHVSHSAFPYAWGWKSLAGNFQTDFTLAGINSSVSLEELFLHHPLEDHSLHELLNGLTSQLHIKNGELLAAEGGFTSHQMKGNFHMSGLLDKMQIHAGIEGTNLQIADLFSMSIQEKTQPFTAKIQIDTDANRTQIQGDSLIGKEEKIAWDIELLHSILFHLKDPLNIKQHLSSLLVDGKKINLDRCFQAMGPRQSLPKKVKGFADFHAQLAGSNLQIALQEHSFSFSFPEFTLTLEDLSPVESSTWKLGYDLLSGEVLLDAPQVKGSCYFPKIKAVLSIESASGKIENNHISLVSTVAHMDKMKIEGDFFYDFSEIDPQVHLLAKSISGDMPHLPFLLEKIHAAPALLYSGKIRGSADIFCTFLPDNPALLGELFLSLSEVSFPLKDSLRMSNGQAEIYADFTSDNYSIDNLVAQIEMPLAQKHKQLTLRAPVLEGKDPDTGRWRYDVRIEDDFHELCRLKGSIETTQDVIGIITESDYSHFLDVPIIAEDLCLNKSFQWKSAHITLGCDLPAFERQLEFFLQTGLFPMTGNLSFLPQSPLKGNILCDFSYHDTLFDYHLFADKIAFQDLLFPSLTVQGQWKEHVWHFDQISCNGFTSSFQIQKNLHNFTLQGFSLSEGNEVKMRMEGFFKENKFEGQIKDVSLSLSECQHQLSRFLQIPQNIQGTITGGGCVTLALPSLSTPIQFEADWDVEAEGVQIGELAIDCKTPFFIQHSLADGIMFQGLDLAFSHEAYDLSNINLKVHHLFYNYEQEKWFFQDTRMQLPCDIFHTITTARFFKEIPPLEEFMELIAHSAHFEHPIDIQTNIECSSDFSRCKAEAKEGDFSVNGKIRHFKDLSFGFSPTSSDLGFSILYNDQYYTLENMVNWTGAFYVMTSIHEKNHRPEKPLTMTWSWDEKWGLRIATLTGELPGLSATFFEESQLNLAEPPSMMGSLKVDFSKALSLLPKESQTLAKKLQLGNGFEILGRWKQTPKETTFAGSLVAKKFGIGGYEFKTLFSKINYSSDNFTLKDFELSDESGTVLIPAMTFSQDKSFSIPLIGIKELRPSLMKQSSGATQEMNPLVIRKLKLEDLRGNFADKKSITGKGDLSFINTFKRDYSVLDIPSELIGRLVGLDLELLIPVRGSIDYEIYDGKCVITKMEKTFSEGGRSKFFIVEDDRPYIDFDGKINVHVKMKQFVLFKLTENFILSLEGNLDKPHFTMKKKKSFYSLLEH